MNALHHQQAQQVACGPWKADIFHTAVRFKCGFTLGQKQRSTTIMYTLWFKSLPLGSSVFTGSAPAQRHADFHKTQFRPRSLFIWKCFRSKIHAVDQEECIVLISFVSEKSNQQYTPYRSVKYIQSIYKNECS